MIDYTKLVLAAAAAGMTEKEISDKFEIDLVQVQVILGTRAPIGPTPPPTPEEIEDQDTPPDEEAPREGRVRRFVRRSRNFAVLRTKDEVRAAAGRGAGFLDEQFGLLARPVTRRIRNRIYASAMRDYERYGDDEDLSRGGPADPPASGGDDPSPPPDVRGGPPSGDLTRVINTVDRVMSGVETSIAEVTRSVIERLDSMRSEDRETQIRGRENDLERSPSGPQPTGQPLPQTKAAMGAGAAAGLLGAAGISELTGLTDITGGEQGPPPPEGGSTGVDLTGDPSKDLIIKADEIILQADEIVSNKPLGGPVGWAGALSGGEGGQMLGGPDGYGGADPRQSPDGSPARRGGSGSSPSTSGSVGSGSGPSEGSRLTSPERMDAGGPAPDYSQRGFKVDPKSSAPTNTLATRRVGIGEGQPGEYSGTPTSASDAMMRSIMVAETGSSGSMLDEKRFIRTMVEPKPGERHSSAYGPVQMTRTYLEDFRNKHGESLPQEEREYLDRLIDQNQKMLDTSKAGDFNDPVYGFGGTGTTGQTLRDRQLYGQVAQRSIVNLAKESDSYEDFIRRFRGANDPAYFDKIEREARRLGKTPQQLFEELRSMSVSDVPALGPGGMSPEQTARMLDPTATPDPNPVRRLLGEPSPEQLGNERTGLLSPEGERPPEPMGPMPFDQSRFGVGEVPSLGEKMNNLSLETELRRRADAMRSAAPAETRDQGPTPPTKIQRDEQEMEPPETSIEDHFEEGFPGLGKRSRHSGLGM